MDVHIIIQTKLIAPLVEVLLLYVPGERRYRVIQFQLRTVSSPSLFYPHYFLSMQTCRLVAICSMDIVILS